MTAVSDPLDLFGGFDRVALSIHARRLGEAFMRGSAPVLFDMIHDPRVPADLLRTAIVRAHIAGLASALTSPILDDETLDRTVAGAAASLRQDIVESPGR